MKAFTPFRFVFVSIALACFIMPEASRAADITIYDSVFALATNVTQNFTFADPTNELEVVVAVTMTPYSSVTNSPTFSLLDGDTRVGVESGTGGGDGNWMNNTEGADFSAILISASSGILTNSISFGIVGIGVRPEGAILWNSTFGTNFIHPPDETLISLDTGVVQIAAIAYNGALRLKPGDSQIQLSNQSGLSGQSFVVRATYVEGSGEPVIVLNPSNVAVCAGQIVSLTAIAYGDPNPTVQWLVQTNGGIEFVDIPGETNHTLTFVSSSISSGNQYRSVFSNALGSATSTVATLNVADSITAIISPSTPTVSPLSTTNTASAPPGLPSYHWDIENGVILGSTTGQMITFQAGLDDDVILYLSVSNEFGCADNTSSNLPIVFAAVTGGDGIYVSDDAHIIMKCDTSGEGSLFAIHDLNYPSGLAFDRAGNLYVANYGGGTIVKITTNGIGSVFAGGLDSPYPIAMDGDGNIFVANHEDHDIWKFDTNGVGTLFADSNLEYPAGLAFDRDGLLYVANNDGTIWRFDTNGVGSLFTEGLQNPFGLAFDSAGNLFVAGYQNGTIEKVTPDGGVVNFATGLSDPIGLAFDRAGDLYATDSDKVLKFSPDGNSVVFTTNIYVFAEFVAVWPIPNQLIPANPAAFANPTQTGNHIQFSVTGSDGAEYVAQATTNLITAGWESLMTSAAPFLLIDTNMAAYPDRYYRAIGAP